MKSIILFTTGIVFLLFSILFKGGDSNLVFAGHQCWGPNVAWCQVGQQAGCGGGQWCASCVQNEFICFGPCDFGDYCTGNLRCCNDNPPCDCSTWTNQSCGGGGCSVDRMYQTRPACCSPSTQCDPNPNSACAPAVNFSAVPSSGDPPLPGNLRWWTLRMPAGSNCTLSGGQFGAGILVTGDSTVCTSAPPCTQPYGPIFADTTYTLSCSNFSGTSTQLAAVDITPVNLSCTFLPPYPLEFPGVGSLSDPYWVERGLDFFDVRGSPSPVGDIGPADFSYCRNASAILPDEPTCSPIEPSAPSAPYNPAIPGWQIRWGDGTDAPSCDDPVYGPECLFDSPDYLTEPPYYSVKVLNPDPPYTGALGACFFDILPPANATYWITARGEIKATSAQRSKNNPQGWILPYYPEGVPPFGSTSIEAPTPAEIRGKFPSPPSGCPSLSTFAALRAQLEAGGGGALDGKRCPSAGALTFTGDINVAPGMQAVVYLQGAPTINANVTISSDSSVVFVVEAQGAETIRISKNVTRLDGIWYTLGNINTAYNLIFPAEITPRLTVEGALISVDGTIRFLRNLSEADNLKYPAEKIIFPARYYLTNFMGSPSLLGEATASWREVSP